MAETDDEMYEIEGKVVAGIFPVAVGAGKPQLQGRMVDEVHVMEDKGDAEMLPVGIRAGIAMATAESHGNHGSEGMVAHIS